MATPSESCPFCHPPRDRVFLAREAALAIRDRFPLTPGHVLVVPRRHVGSVFELSMDEQQALWALVAEARERIRAAHRPDGFNVGVNDGPVAGQTIAHAHVHLIPRRSGDTEDPRGGVRWVLPDRAPYWEGES